MAHILGRFKQVSPPIPLAVKVLEITADGLKWFKEGESSGAYMLINKESEVLSTFNYTVAAILFQTVFSFKHLPLDIIELSKFRDKLRKDVQKQQLIRVT